jgi:type II secretory pathway pseudopilin PulG
MSDPNQSRPTPLGIYDRPNQPVITAIEMIALGLSLIWLIGSGVFFLTIGPDPASDAGAEAGLSSLRFIMTMLAIFLPVAMIWVAAAAARASKVMREESHRLQAAIDAIRHAYLSQAQGRGAVMDQSVAKKLDEIAAAQRKTETALATFHSTRETQPMRLAPAPDAASGSEQQVDLPLGTRAEDMVPPLPRDVFIRAMNFPENAEDAEGFTALRQALKHRQASELVRASQDLLTLLSQDGIYMDDLRPDMARPEIWRKFAAGERGRAIAGLGGVRDRSSLALTSGRMRQDPIFRDAAHHFLRKFDQIFSEFADVASDEELSEFANTRTARAFMLVGRVAGTFD